jgi:hypothetical protein
MSGAARSDEVCTDVPREGPLPASAQSVVMTDASAITILAEPSMASEVRGRALPGASFPVLATHARGNGCRRLWLRIDEAAWICGDYGQLSRLPAHPARPTRPGEALPWSYAFTGHDGVRAYRTYEAAVARPEDPSQFEAWEANWGFAVAEIVGAGGGRALRTLNGFYLRRNDIYRASPTDFQGGSFRELAGDEPDVPFGWVSGYGARVFPAPREQGEGAALERLARVHVFATAQGPRGVTFARIGPERWVRADHLRWIAPAPPPEGVDLAARERWIDVDLTTQTLVAYEGEEPVYATLVSSGRGTFATVPGVFRIHTRYLSLTMDNTEATNLPNHFRLGDVPYVQFFDGDRGLHAVYWHDGFGVARSHGCINMAPRDAAFLFDFTSSPLPAGWSSMAVPAGRGTVVRVRGHYEAG